MRELHSGRRGVVKTAGIARHERLNSSCYNRRMCGRYVLRSIDLALSAFNASLDPGFEEFTERPRFNIALTQDIAAVRARSCHSRTLRTYRCQRPVICSSVSEYRAPCTVIPETAASTSQRSSGAKTTAAAPTFCSSVRRRSGLPDALQLKWRSSPSTAWLRCRSAGQAGCRRRSGVCRADRPGCPWCPAGNARF